MDKISFEKNSVLSKGYGILPKKVMTDTQLTIEAKAIYAYLVSYAGAGEIAFPGVEIMLHHLKISKDRFYRHRKLLIQQGYIRVVSVTNPRGEFKNNHYIILSTPCPCFADTDNPTTDNKDTNSNSLNSNSLNSNSNNTYITLASDELFLDFYLKTHKKYLGKNHVRVTHEQKEYIERSIEEIMSMGIEYDMWQEAVLEHFQKLPKKNNGNILAFLKASFRYFEVELNTA
jgi:hypothetical protein